MPTETEKQYLVAINEGLNTSGMIAQRMGVADITARRKVFRLIENGWVVVTQNYFSKGGRVYPTTYGLTKAGAEVAHTEIVPEASIKDSCDRADYHQWLGEMRQAVRGNEEAVKKRNYTLHYFNIRRSGQEAKRIKETSCQK